MNPLLWLLQLATDFEMWAKKRADRIEMEAIFTAVVYLDKAGEKWLAQKLREHGDALARAYVYNYKLKE